MPLKRNAMPPMWNAMPLLAERYATAYRHMASCGLPLVLSSSRHALMIPSRSTSLQAAASAF